ncbi:MAG TPA: MBL fold metallo-hydrolase [Anaeromyxobacter sp.]|nr:MBL fold metallo-hydrolase [Anaeromyxobacter sp.]
MTTLPEGVLDPGVRERLQPADRRRGGASSRPDPPRRRVLRSLLARLLVRLAVAAALLAAGGELFSRAWSGGTSPPVPVAPGIVAEHGAGTWLYAVRLADGVALVDTGRDRKGRPIDVALGALGARRADVTDVLLTHGHPAETVGLAAVPAARVHAGVGDVDVIAGRERAGRGLDRLLGLVLPRTTARVANPIGGEEAISIDGDRILAFPVPGHSLGSTAYLIRGVLFLGDAASLKDGHLVPGPRFMSADPGRGARSLAHLARRLADTEVSLVCTAHTGCSGAGSGKALLAEAAGQTAPGAP